MILNFTGLKLDDIHFTLFFIYYQEIKTHSLTPSFPLESTNLSISHLGRISIHYYKARWLTVNPPLFLWTWQGRSFLPNSVSPSATSYNKKLVTYHSESSICFQVASNASAWYVFLPFLCFFCHFCAHWYRVKKLKYKLPLYSVSGS